MFIRGFYHISGIYVDEKDNAKAPDTKRILNFNQAKDSNPVALNLYGYNFPPLGAIEKALQ